MSDQPTETENSLPVQGEETEYYQRINVMLVDLGTDTLLKLFKSLIPNGEVSLFLKSNSEDLKKRLSQDQYRRISKEKFDEKELDIAILIKLMFELLPKQLEQAHRSSKNPPLKSDLKKLRTIRNELVGHRPAAKITKEDFIAKWGDISTILTRIVPDSLSREELDGRIKRYKTCALSPSVVNEILDKLQELSNLLKQIKELREQKNDFKLFFEQVPEQYIRYVILLLDGGRLVLHGVLDREMKKKNVSFDELVQENPDKFPDDITDISCLDISVLAEIILTLFEDSIGKSVKENIQCIRDARNNYVGSAKLSLDTNKFMFELIKLTMSLQSLLTNMDDKSNDSFKKILQKSQTEHFDHNTVAEYLNQLKGNGNRTLQEEYADTLRELKTLCQTAEDAGIPFQEEELKMKVVVRCKNPEVKRMVEEALLADFQTAMKKSIRSDTDQQLDKIDTLLRELRGENEDVTITGVYKKCIIIVLQLPTYRAMKYLINLMQGAYFGRHIEHISRMLCLEYEEAISIEAKLTIEGMKRLSDRMAQQSKIPLTQENVQEVVSKPTKMEQSVTPLNGRKMCVEIREEPSSA